MKPDGIKIANQSGKCQGRVMRQAMRQRRSLFGRRHCRAYMSRRIFVCAPVYGEKCGRGIPLCTPKVRPGTGCGALRSLEGGPIALNQVGRFIDSVLKLKTADERRPYGDEIFVRVNLDPRHLCRLKERFRDS
jgi:hypothetical protein